MTKPFGGTVKYRAPSPGLIQQEETKIAGDDLTKGIITTKDSTIIPEDAVVDALNTRIRVNGMSRRDGTSILTPTAPDASRILSLNYFKKNDGTEAILRFTPTKIYKRGAGSWTEITPSSSSIAGGDYDRFNVAAAFDTVVFTNNKDYIQQINAALTTYARLGNAPKYRFTTVFYNRVVGAGYIDTPANPIQVGWSGDGNITQWDPLVDLSAGSNPLIESPGDLSDFITGVFGFSSYMIITRERSIWVATKNPSATNPFYFYADVPGLGCNLPYATAVIPGGICFADTESQSIYAYTPGNPPTPISGNIDVSLFTAITDLNRVFGSYDRKYAEYSIAIPSADESYVKVWVYSFKTKSWVYDERPGLTCIGDLNALASTLTIDDLPGPSIDSLPWATIDSIANDANITTARVYGFKDGRIEQETAGADTDSGAMFLSRQVSKQIMVPLDLNTVNTIQYEVDVKASGDLNLYVSKDKGKSWKFLKTLTFGALDIDKSRILSFKKALTSRTLMLKLESMTGKYDVLRYRISGIKSSIASGMNK